MKVFDTISSWISSIIAGPLAKVSSTIEDALSAAKSLLPEVDVPTFVDMFRETMRESQFAEMLQNPDVPQLAKDTEFLEADYVMPRNYLAKFFVQYVDETTGEIEEGYRSMYVDERLSNADLTDMFLSLDRGAEYQPRGEISFITLDSITHSQGSPYGKF